MSALMPFIFDFRAGSSSSDLTMSSLKRFAAVAAAAVVDAAVISPLEATWRSRFRSNVPFNSSWNVLVANLRAGVVSLRSDHPEMPWKYFCGFAVTGSPFGFAFEWYNPLLSVGIVWSSPTPAAVAAPFTALPDGGCFDLMVILKNDSFFSHSSSVVESVGDRPSLPKWLSNHLIVSSFRVSSSFSKSIARSFRSRSRNASAKQKQLNSITLDKQQNEWNLLWVWHVKNVSTSMLLQQCFLLATRFAHTVREAVPIGYILLRTITLNILSFS